MEIDKRVANASEPVNNSDLVTKKYHDDNLSSINSNLSQYQKKSDKITLHQNLDTNNFNIQSVKSRVNSHDAISLSFLINELSDYAHRTGTDFSGDIDTQNNSIYGIKSVDNNFSVVNKLYVDSKISKIKPNNINLSPFLKRDGSVVMTNNLNLNNNKLINVKKGTGNKDAVNLEQLNEANSVLATIVSKSYLKKDGSTLLTGNLNLNGHKFVNRSSPVNKNDSVNKLYVDQKETHISSHQNRKNVFKYITDNVGEFTSDYETSSVNSIDDFDDMPHKIRKKTIFF